MLKQTSLTTVNVAAQSFLIMTVFCIIKLMLVSP